LRISGATLLARRELLVRQFGSEAWRALFANISRTHPCFRAPITAATLLPVEPFLRFHDELVLRFYGDDPHAYFRLGEESAFWALSVGPFRELLTPKLETIAAASARVWSAYFAETSSRCEVTVESGSFHLRTYALPESHPYFERSIAGYFKGALELICANPITMEKQASSEPLQYHYRFCIDSSAAQLAPQWVGRALGIRPTPEHGGPISALKRRRTDPSERELEVLRLIALGKTNKEIGELLQISARTVQKHVASSYNKLGLYSRAGAVAWLVENDLR
jgi:DNA-binding CsgD family transcriptional regulator